MKVDRSEAPKYGMIRPGDSSDSVAGLVEKPAEKDAPSEMASIGRYLLEADIFDILRQLPPGAGGEIQLADAIDIQARVGRVRAVLLNGLRFDCGSKFGYLEAIVDFASDHPEYGDAFRNLMIERVLNTKAA